MKGSWGKQLKMWKKVNFKGWRCSSAETALLCRMYTALAARTGWEDSCAVRVSCLCWVVFVTNTDWSHLEEELN